MRKKMRIGILDFYNIQKAERTSASFNIFSKKAPKGFILLSNAIRKLGHRAVIYHPEHCELFFEGKRSTILYKQHEIKGCDVLIPRINVVSRVGLELSFIKQFQLMGIPVLNKYLPISRAMNKLSTLQILTRAKIPVPATIVVRRFEYLDEAINMVGGYPVVIKTPYGTHGRGVAIIESRRSLYSALDILWRFNRSNVFLIQEYVAESSSCDYRAFVIGNKIVASMMRKAAQGDFRSNLFLGGEGSAVELTEQEKKMALRATRALNLDSCGVDILRTNNGPVIAEINACAGFTGISEVSGIDVPKKLVQYAINLAEENLKKKT